MGNSLMLTGKTYDKAKFAVQVVIPATSTLYFTLDKIWGLWAAAQITGTLAAIATFFGAILFISSKSYYDSNNADGKYAGDLVIFKDEDNIAHARIEFNQLPEEVVEKENATFKVVSTRSQ